jgi:hypothetical protein
VREPRQTSNPSQRTDKLSRLEKINNIWIRTRVEDEGEVIVGVCLGPLVEADCVFLKDLANEWEPVGRSTWDLHIHLHPRSTLVYTNHLHIDVFPALNCHTYKLHLLLVVLEGAPANRRPSPSGSMRAVSLLQRCQLLFTPLRAAGLSAGSKCFFPCLCTNNGSELNTPVPHAA